jgi:Domain of unknown function (DUF4351)
MTTCFHRARSPPPLIFGTAKALVEARTQTLADVLSRQLRRRFGELPPSFTERIQSASGEELDAWMDRVMDAASVSDVFDDKRVN